ncbi:MAG: hypothetical protein PHN51_10465 [Candidatus Nanopelagicales bacterium]|nr:hypothetical protein [Candidatus Nanopelagicales bacterium]
MPTFVLKKYNPKSSPAEGEGVVSAPTDSKVQEQKAEIEKTMRIRATRSVSEIVALALYKTLPNGVDVTEADDKEPTQAGEIEKSVISTDDINNDPAGTLQQVKQGQDLTIIGSGFSTEKDEWFLLNVKNKDVKTTYSLPTFIGKIQAELGV